MKRISCLLVLMCASAPLLASNSDPFSGPEPVAVLIQTNPWLMVIGSDTPRIAIYDDGQVIYFRQDKDNSGTYLQTQLTQEELDVIKKKLIGFGDYSKVKKYYNVLPNSNDQPETKIYLNVNGEKMVTTVYGLMVQETKLPAFTVLPGSPNADVLPESVRSLHSYLTTLHFEDAKPWQPRFVEVIIWPYEYAPDKSIHWPKEWPGLDSPDTLPRGWSYSIFLPGTELTKLRDFLNTRKEKGAVEVGGKKWAASYRYVFPSEPIWVKAFRSSH